jgi:Domain of unknown function (DUF4259)
VKGNFHARFLGGRGRVNRLRLPVPYETFRCIHKARKVFMGTWAVGSFESDTALDWLTQVYESGDFSMVGIALTGDLEHAEPYVGAIAVAAADLVACSLGHPPPEPKRRALVEWTQQYADVFTPELLALARTAVATIKRKSKLRDAWRECDGTTDPAWLASISHLERRLQS